MRPPRLKLRTLIVLVALATLAVGAFAYQKRAARYRAMAARESAREREAATLSAFFAEWSKSQPERDRQRLANIRKSRENIRRSNQRMIELVKDKSPLVRRLLGIDSDKLRREIEASRKDETRYMRELEMKCEQAQRQAHVDLREYRDKAIFHARRRAAYLRCARYPWLSPPAEEPEPK